MNNHLINRIILQSDGHGRHPITERTGYSIQSIHRLEKAGTFPARLQLGPGKVGWTSESIDAWEASRGRGPLPAPQSNAAGA